MGKIRAGAQKAGFPNPYMTKDMAHMLLKLKLLGRIKHKEVYSYALVKEFDNPTIAGFLKKRSSIKNDIYNTVKALEKSNYIKVKAKIENNRLKKYYYITNDGKRALRESRNLFLASMKELMKIVR